MENKTPRDLGYFMPAEWEPHEGTWLIWPHDDTHKNTQLHLERIWLEMTLALHENELVHVIVKDEARWDHLTHQFNYYGVNESNINIHIVTNNDVWVRDCGPVFLVNTQGDLAVTEWNFNGWGQRYPFEKDRLVPKRVAKILSLPLFSAPITLEGGAIEVNGQGTLVATRSSIVNPNRNPGLSMDEIETAIKDYLGVQHIIWLSGAPREFCDLVGSDTDLHVDGYARFTNESTLLYSWTDDESNYFFPYLKQHRDELCNASIETGKPLTLAPLPKPRNEMYSTLSSATKPPFDSNLSLGTYANFYIANNVVLVPVYGDINDANAKSIISEHFPGRDVIGIPAWVTAERGGMMHCVTQQQPFVTNFHGNFS
jgi:agmatine deiminase